MEYTIKAIPTIYNDVQFRSRLEARWAAFFDLVDWKWEYEPIDLDGWLPDFRIQIPCSHSECNDHELLVEVKPVHFNGVRWERVRAINEYVSTHQMNKFYGRLDVESPVAIFGNNPFNTCWYMSHGVGGGEQCVTDWVENDCSKLWKQAGNKTQWKPQKNKHKLDAQSLDTIFQSIFKPIEVKKAPSYEWLKHAFDLLDPNTINNWDVMKDYILLAFEAKPDDSSTDHVCQMLYQWVLRIKNIEWRNSVVSLMQQGKHHTAPVNSQAWQTLRNRIPNLSAALTACGM